MGIKDGDSVNDISEAYFSIQNLVNKISPYADWIRQNWVLLVLTGEIIGAVVAIKVGRYRRGLFWLVAALATIWLGAYR